MAKEISSLPVRLPAVATEARERAPQAVERDVSDREDAELGELEIRCLHSRREDGAPQIASTGRNARVD